MNFLSSEQKSTLILVSLFAFMTAWSYTEIEEYFSRDRFKQEVVQFMSKGNRNTADQGYDLCVRIEHLERQHHMPSSAPDCDLIYHRGEYHAEEE